MLKNRVIRVVSASLLGGLAVAALVAWLGFMSSTFERGDMVEWNGQPALVRQRYEDGSYRVWIQGDERGYFERFAKADEVTRWRDESPQIPEAQ